MRVLIHVGWGWGLPTVGAISNGKCGDMRKVGRIYAGGEGRLGHRFLRPDPRVLGWISRPEPQGPQIWTFQRLDLQDPPHPWMQNTTVGPTARTPCGYGVSTVEHSSLCNQWMCDVVDWARAGEGESQHRHTPHEAVHTVSRVSERYLDPPHSNASKLSDSKSVQICRFESEAKSNIASKSQMSRQKGFFE